MKALITGASGFIGRNLTLRLQELKDWDVRTWSHQQSTSVLATLVSDVDVVFHLAGVNRPNDPVEFAQGNTGSIEALCAALITRSQQPIVILSSSTQAALDNDYGRSKAAAERVLAAHAGATNASALIFRLPNVFGKWARPNYNSAVATFCHNIAHGLPVSVRDPAAALALVYVDDVITCWLDALRNVRPGVCQMSVQPVYHTTVGEMLGQIQRFHRDRGGTDIAEVGTGLARALHATYLSYLTPAQFAYPLRIHSDPRGSFVEMLKTDRSGQISFFTAHPGITRGGHYHHTKSEKFLVVRGRARYRFRNVSSGELHTLESDGQHPLVVETVPGWAHDITNIGDEDMIVLLWANERFDPQQPDTIASALA